MEKWIESHQFIGLWWGNENKLDPSLLFQFHLVFSNKIGISKNMLGNTLKSNRDLAPGVLYLSFITGAVFMLGVCWMV